MQAFALGITQILAFLDVGVPNTKFHVRNIVEKFCIAVEYRLNIVLSLFLQVLLYKITIYGYIDNPDSSARLLQK